MNLGTCFYWRWVMAIGKSTLPLSPSPFLCGPLFSVFSRHHSPTIPPYYHYYYYYSFKFLPIHPCSPPPTSPMCGQWVVVAGLLLHFTPLLSFDGAPHATCKHSSETIFVLRLYINCNMINSYIKILGFLFIKTLKFWSSKRQVSGWNSESVRGQSRGEVE